MKISRAYQQLSPSDASALAPRVDGLEVNVTDLTSYKAKINKENYMISEIPIYLNRKKFNKVAPFTTLEVLDIHESALAVEYGTGLQNFYKVDLDSLTQELLFTTTQASDPFWYCARLLPRYASDYDYVIAYSYNLKKVFRLSTNAVVQTGFTDQKLGWLRNTGFDWTPDATGCTQNGYTMIYAEYILSSYADYPTTTEVKVWRSIDRGATWTNVFTKNTRNHASPEVFHFHIVKRDPYNAGHWYLSSGDEPSESFIWRSTDDGLTWTEINDPLFAGERQKIHRTTNMYFTADAIYWAVDDFINVDGLGSTWVKADRNIGGTLIVTPLADLRNWNRQVVQTPYGLIILTENRPTDTKALVWLAPYDDLENPILIARTDGVYANQISDHAYGSRIVLADGGLDNLYNKAPDNKCKFGIMTVNKLTR